MYPFGRFSIPVTQSERGFFFKIKSAILVTPKRTVVVDLGNSYCPVDLATAVERNVCFIRPPDLSCLIYPLPTHTQPTDHKTLRTLVRMDSWTNEAPYLPFYRVCVCKIPG